MKTPEHESVSKELKRVPILIAQDVDELETALGRSLNAGEQNAYSIGYRAGYARALDYAQRELAATLAATLPTTAPVEPAKEQKETLDLIP